MAIKIIDDSILQDIAVAIQEKDGGGKMLDTEMAGRVEAISSGGEGIPRSPDSDTPIFFGVNENGFYICTTEDEKTDVAFGRDGMNVYAELV